MKTERRLSICYAAPGLNLLPSSGPTRNVLGLARALSRWANVTVAFRGLAEPADVDNVGVMLIDDRSTPWQAWSDDNAMRGLRPLDHLAYCRRVWSFGARSAGAFDIVFEKGWRLSGLLAWACQRAGVRGVLVENDVRRWTEPVRGAAGVGKYALHVAGERAARLACQRLPLIIAETDELKAMLVARRGLSPERIEVVGLGVDHDLFTPADRSTARKALAISDRVLVLLYVGAMDEYHDLAPVIEALGQLDGAKPELHVVGDGEFRRQYEAQAASVKAPVRFHGRVPHASVPRYIAAADLCLAPYRASAFYENEVFFSTLKIPEYMACARPVATVPGSATGRLVEHGVNGFTVANDAASWLTFLKSIPGPDGLDLMGRAAARTVSGISWDATARRYLELSAALLESPSAEGGVNFPTQQRGPSSPPNTRAM
jgi:glycosyltransferase involved in cell wall biosynthesis